MKKSIIALVIVLLCVGFVASGCSSLICHPSRKDRPKVGRDGIDWTMFAGNVLIFGGIIGLIVDFSTGAIYKSTPEYRDKYPMLPPMEETKPMDQESS